MVTESRSVVLPGAKGRKRDLTAKGQMETVGLTEMFRIMVVVVVIQLYIYQNTN